MSSPRRRILAAGMAGLAIPAVSRAQGNRSIRIVVPFAADGTTDIVARLVAQHMAETLGQPVVVDNRPGGNGIIAAEMVARAPKDGLTLLAGGTATLSLNSLLRPNLPYRLEDFVSVALLCDAPLSLTVNAAVPAQDVSSFVAFSRSRPNPLRYATNGPGSTSHLFGLMLADALGLTLQDVVYRGNGPSTADLLTGVIEVGVEAPIVTLEHVRAGKLRILGLSFDERSALLPAIPSFREAGYPRLTTSFWTGLSAPTGTPPEAVQRLNAAASRAMASEVVRRRMAADASRGFVAPPDRLDQQLAQDRVQWGEVIRRQNIILD
ncbi:Bug family tripartite tricarboxylate transporter substrate binding protein [Muricoccus radiodurans]|uniref:Bug family tripartite tricarboxylate transporter substrate binding protein n=1 Tax=Muricoccus radiodurans TaxID=2231721 RepID=UPI003CF9B291